MGITKQHQLEEADKEQARLDREHQRLGKGCPVCHGELDREDCESLQEAQEKND